jgi:hypothetical protein
MNQFRSRQVLFLHDQSRNEVCLVLRLGDFRMSALGPLTL